MNFILQILISTLAIMVTSFFLPGVEVEHPLTAIIVAVVLAFLNSVLKPIMVMISLPITIASFGLFLVVINAILIKIADLLVDDFTVKSFWWALLFSIILAIVTSIFESFRNRDNQE